MICTAELCELRLWPRRLEVYGAGKIGEHDLYARSIHPLKHFSHPGFVSQARRAPSYPHRDEDA